MKGSTNGTLAGIEFLDHAFNLFSESCLVEVDTKDVTSAVELFQRTPVLVCLANLQRCHDSLQLLQQWVGRWLESGTVVLDAFQIAGIASQGQWDEDEVRHVKTSCDVFLDGLPEADRQLL